MIIFSEFVSDIVGVSRVVMCSFDMFIECNIAEFEMAGMEGRITNIRTPLVHGLSDMKERKNYGTK